MRTFTIVSNSEELRYFFHINGPFAIEIDAPGANFFITIRNEDDDTLDIEIPFEAEDFYIPYMLQYEDGFMEKAFDMLYDESEKMIVEFLNSDRDIFKGDTLKNHLSDKLTSLAHEYAMKYQESFKNDSTCSNADVVDNI